MASFTEKLHRLDPAITENEAAGFRSGLLAILQQMQEAPELPEQSLNDWWQWLEEEGYEHETCAAVLSRVSRAVIGETAFLDLSAYARAIAAAPHGLPTLIALVHERHPALGAELETLEQLAAAEENALLSTAGGMSKAGRDALIGVAATVGVVGTGYLGYKAGSKIHSWWTARRSRLEQAAAHDARAELDRSGGLKGVADDVAHRDGKEMAVKVEAAVQHGRANGESLRNEVQAVEQADPLHTADYKFHHFLTDTTVKAKLKDLGINPEGEGDQLLKDCLKTLTPDAKGFKIYQGLGGITRDAESDLNCYDKYIGHAVRAEVRKNYRETGKLINKELRPELDNALSDADIDKLFSIDKIITHEAINMGKVREALKDSISGNTPLGLELNQWGAGGDLTKGYRNFATNFEARYPGTKAGLREYIRDHAMAGLEKADREKILRNLMNSTDENVAGFLRKDVCEGMIKAAAKEAEKEAIRAAREAEELGEMKQDLARFQQDVLESKRAEAVARKAKKGAVNEAENFVINKRDFKKTMDKVVANKDSELEKSVETKVSNEFQTAEMREETAVKKELDSMASNEVEALAGEIETAAGAAERKAETGLEDAAGAVEEDVSVIIRDSEGMMV